MAESNWRVRLVGPDGESTVKVYRERAGWSRSTAEMMADRKRRQYPSMERGGLEFVAEEVGE